MSGRRGAASPAADTMESAFFDRARETAPPETLRAWQWERLQGGLGEILTRCDAEPALLDGNREVDAYTGSKDL